FGPSSHLHLQAHSCVPKPLSFSENTDLTLIDISRINEEHDCCYVLAQVQPTANPNSLTRPRCEHRHPQLLDVQHSKYYTCYTIPMNIPYPIRRHGISICNLTTVYPHLKNHPSLYVSAPTVLLPLSAQVVLLILYSTQDSSFGELGARTFTRVSIR
ncbi:ubiquitin conjugating, partial [Moniliophthora roreri]